MQATPELVEAFRSAQGFRQQTGAMHAARAAGWTLAAIGDVVGLSRDGVRRRLLAHPDPAVPAGFTEEPVIPPDVEDRLLDLYVQARRVNGATPEGHPDREATEEFTALLAGLVGQGVSRPRLARVLGVTPTALSLRLARHGYMKPPPSTRAHAYKGRPRILPPKEPKPPKPPKPPKEPKPPREQCKRGHPWTPGHPNVQVDPKSGKRSCRACNQQRARESYARRNPSPRRAQPDIPQDVMDRLLALEAQARRVGGGTPVGHPDRVASAEYIALLADLVGQGVSARRLSLALGLSKGAVAERLREHRLRGQGAAVYVWQPAQRRDECKWGHPMTPGHPNVKVAPKSGNRSCRECNRRRERERREKVRAASDAWAVYEWERGVVWAVTPATKARAEQEAAALSGPGSVHTAFPLSVAEHLRNAHAYGRQQGHAEAKARAAVRGAAS